MRLKAHMWQVIISVYVLHMDLEGCMDLIYGSYVLNEGDVSRIEASFWLLHLIGILYRDAERQNYPNHR